jgi:hypothetical protein
VEGGQAEAQPNVLPARGLCLMEVRYPASPWRGEAPQAERCIMTAERNREDDDDGPPVGGK